jgi:hypothetical protein
MAKRKFESIKDFIAYIKPLFNGGNYSNNKLLKSVLAFVAIIIFLWIISSMVFVGNIYNYVSGKSSALTEKANTEIREGSDRIGYAGQKMTEFWDERRAASELNRKYIHQEKLAKLEKVKKRVADFVAWSATASYEEYTHGQSHRSYVEAEYFGKCRGSIESWMSNRAFQVETKLSLAAKYKQQVAEGNYDGNGERKAKEEYIRRIENLDTNVSKSYLVNILKTRFPNEVRIESDHRDIESMCTCINLADQGIRALYYSTYRYSQSYMAAGSDAPVFINYKLIADVLEVAQDLDFTIPLLLTSEDQLLKKEFISPKGWDGGSIIFAAKDDPKRMDYHPQEVLRAVEVMEMTNQKLAEIDPNNTGFKTNAYKFRMQQYEFLKSRIAAFEAQQIGMQKQKEEREIKLAEAKLKEILLAKKAEEKQLSIWENSMYPPIDHITYHKKRIKALMQQEEKAEAHVKFLKGQRKIVSNASKDDNQP